MKLHLLAFWKFCRPHTIIGSNLQILTSIALVYSKPHISPLTFKSFIFLWIACMAMNIFVVGINQLVDIEIDRVNKPELPLAAGEISSHRAKIWVAICAMMAILFSMLSSTILLIMVLLILGIGVIYSLPPLHLKTKPIGAALAIATARGLFFNLGLHLHFNEISGQPLDVSFPAMALAVFIFGFCIVIAVMKDIPDIEGDKIHGVKTLAIQLGPKKAFNISIGILAFCYTVFILGGLFLPMKHHTLFVLSHVGIVTYMLMGSRNVNVEVPKQIYSYYMKLWNVFYFEFIIFIFLFGILT